MMKNTEKHPGNRQHTLPVYLDYNATTPLDPEVADAMEPFLREHFGNPSSTHYYGTVTRSAIENARQQVARLLGARPHEIIFTAGGTESNNMAIQGVAFALQSKGKHIITSAVEHPAVSEVCNYLKDFGFSITRVPVDAYGLVSPEDVAREVRQDTILISIMHANNEVGTIQPLAEIARIAKDRKIVFHSDCAQSVGKIPVSVDDLGVDLLSVAGHKLYAPKGVGALYIRQGTPLRKLIHGADHEQNKRPGTENVLQIVGLGKACELAAENLNIYATNMLARRDQLENGLKEAFPTMQINGHPDHRLPNTLNVSFKNLEASTLLLAMDNVAASAGAACHSDEVTVSPVLEAMGLAVEWSMGTIRFSTGRTTSPEEIDKALSEIVQKVKEFLPDTDLPSPVAPEIDQIRLTHYTHGLGCACKLRPQDLEEVLKSIPVLSHSNTLVGPETADDAAVYRINDDLALVQTVDFFTPVVDDPYQFGAIAATNALSDIYAMGASPAFALNIVGFPAKRLPLSVLSSILLGASDKAAEAGIPVLGGHTIEDNEPKFGMVVSGSVHPDKIWKNEGARPGDVIILTKPLGLGVMSTALKRGLLSEGQVAEISALMTELNKASADLISRFDVHACTDVTGFGLIGHLLEMAKASKVSCEIWPDEIPVIEGAEDFIAAGIIPGGTKNNLAFVRNDVLFAEGITELKQFILSDAQTSGGLLFSLPPEQLSRVLERSKDLQRPFVQIGTIIEPAETFIIVKPKN